VGRVNNFRKRLSEKNRDFSPPSLTEKKIRLLFSLSLDGTPRPRFFFVFFLARRFVVFVAEKEPKKKENNNKLLTNCYDALTQHTHVRRGESEHSHPDTRRNALFLSFSIHIFVICKAEIEAQTKRRRGSLLEKKE
jgi:hypothetical protein